MTPAQLEHLRLIDAHLGRLLDIAAKRTPEKWETDQMAKRPAVFNTEGLFIDTNMRPYDAAFIASCAGNAEAGWKATRAAIKSCLADDPRYQDMFYIANKELVDAILAAFPFESLKP